ncbi:thymidylate kinase [uncultured Pseudoramibacter sp.]|jgi:dTMP kinase|uniref:dTMP kinase n=1 Tax=uncultured Pseudoramibacter sp. TaxID=1623493 RepID=UPI0025EC51A0|nr:thymidylate kinase [uncultured Pseudoramibacter sp.]
MKTERNGRLIVIEGIDGTGKQTQSERLARTLTARQVPVLRVSYPRYDKDSSAMARHYLAGDFGEDPDAVSPYVASTFFAADRYASYQEETGPFLAKGGVVIADRYTTSNLVHQAGKIADAAERDAFVHWLEDYEYRLLGLPRPDLVFFLDMPEAVSEQLMADRANKITGEAEKDIHERDTDYLKRSAACARALAKARHWRIVNCLDGDGQLRAVDDIGDEITAAVLDALKSKSEADA